MWDKWFFFRLSRTRKVFISINVNSPIEWESIATEFKYLAFAVQVRGAQACSLIREREKKLRNSKYIYTHNEAQARACLLALCIPCLIHTHSLNGSGARTKKSCIVTLASGRRPTRTRCNQIALFNRIGSENLVKYGALHFTLEVK